MTDIALRLRKKRHADSWVWKEIADLLDEAADEIERLSDINKRLDKIETLIKRNGT